MTAAGSATGGVSFVMPVYNKAPLLPAVLASVRAQVPDRPRQFIFVDDGSSDDSPDIVRETIADWPDATLIVQNNRGPSSATSVGVQRARHDYIKLVGSDDILAPYATEVLIRGLDETGAAGIFGRMSYYEDPAAIAFDLRGASDKRAWLIPDALTHAVRVAMSGTGQTLYRRDAVEAVGGIDTRIFAEDYSLALRLARRYPIAEIDLDVCYGPSEDPNRIMVGRKHQTLHDVNLALHYFTTEDATLPHAIRQLAFRRSAGRAASWARREGGQTWSRYLWLNALSRLPIPHPERHIRATLDAFRLGVYDKKYPLRYPASLV